MLKYYALILYMIDFQFIRLIIFFIYIGSNLSNGLYFSGNNHKT
jgi:hypothetical protein